MTPSDNATTPAPSAALRFGRRAHRFYPIALVALSALLVGTIWAVPYLPTNDGPEWVFATHAENHYSDAGAPYAAAYAPTLQFASRGLSLFYAPFEAWLGWQHGLQVALSLMVLLAAWGFFALVRALHPGREALGLLGFPFALSWPMYMGFWSFAIGTGLGYFILSLGVRLREPTWRGRAVLAVLLLVQAVAHVFGAVLTGGALLALALARAPRGRRLAETGRVLLMGSPAAAVLVACALVSHDLTHSMFASKAERLPWRNALAALPGTIAPGPFGRALVVSVAIFAAAVLAAFRARRKTTDAADRGLGLAAVLLLLAGVLAPFQIPGWQAFSERFIPLGVALAVAVVPLERFPSGARRFAPATLFGIAALWVGLTYPFHRRLAELCPDAIAGLAAPIQIHGKLLSVVLAPTELAFYNRTEAEVPLMDPLVHMGSLYAAAHGGIPLHSFAGNAAVHPFVKRADASHPPEPDFLHYTKAINSYAFHHDPAFRHDVDDQLASFGVFYDEVAIFGARADDLAVWRDRGFVADWEGRTSMVARFEACSIDFTVRAVDAAPAPSFDIRVGEIGFVSNAGAPFIVRSDGLAHFTLAPAPCGNVTVRARWADGGSAARYCNNANAEGDLVAHVARGMNRFACEGR